MTAKRAKRKAPTHQEPSAVSRALLWAPVALSLLGIGISGYLVVKRFTGGGLACTRWAQCDVVNNSLYSQISGVPVSLLGLIGYLALLAAAASALVTTGQARRLALGLGFLMALGGFGFSLWLTYVEIYIIEALCSWCVASALVITLLTAVGAVNLRGRSAGGA
jgi:uncharacterized membrane protein